jgi:hypothetical protein
MDLRRNPGVPGSIPGGPANHSANLSYCKPFLSPFFFQNEVFVDDYEACDVGAGAFLEQAPIHAEF